SRDASREMFIVGKGYKGPTVRREGAGMQPDGPTGGASG
ncbi:hypothetical protein MNBD_PLANCTO03-521, partial [hydrothermal vent metagenome]